MFVNSYSMQRICIVTNGTLDESLIAEAKAADVVIGVDRAAYWLLKRGVVPTIAIGDFDSCNSQELSAIKRRVADTRVFVSAKNFTDTELAVESAIAIRPGEIVIIGGSGSRIDHTLATLGLLERCLVGGIPAVFQDKNNRTQLIGRGRTILQRRGEYRYVSILPYTKTIQVSLSGFKYGLHKKTIARGSTLGVSNEFSDRQAVVTIFRGKALVVQSRD